MKHEWKKYEADIYSPKTAPQLVEIPAYKYFMIQGKGNPNDGDFAERVGVLFSLSWAVKMLHKSANPPEGYYEYTVYPLEGIWMADNVKDKNSYSYTIMVRQPDFVTSEIASTVFEIVRKKKPHPLLEQAYFDTMEDELSLQILHVGDYDNEYISFKVLEDYMRNNNLERKSEIHREIYLSDARKVDRNKLKTILRYSVRSKGM